MILVSDVRCSDCLNEFKDGPRFAVVKEDKSQTYSDEERQLSGHLYEVFVCGDCVKWYGDEAAAVPDQEGEGRP